MQSLYIYIRKEPMQCSILEQFMQIIRNTFYKDKYEYVINNKQAPPDVKYISIHVSIGAYEKRIRIINNEKEKSTENYLKMLFEESCFLNKKELSNVGFNADEFMRVCLNIRCLVMKDNSRLTNDEKLNILRLLSEGYTKTSIALKYNVSIQSITRVAESMKKRRPA